MLNQFSDSNTFRSIINNTFDGIDHEVHICINQVHNIEFSAKPISNGKFAIYNVIFKKGSGYSQLVCRTFGGENDSIFPAIYNPITNQFESDIYLDDDEFCGKFNMFLTEALDGMFSQFKI
jgi:hypothetical protein